MLHVPVGANTFCAAVPSWGTARPAAANGTAVTPAAGSFGSWATVQTALATDCYGLMININSNTTSSASRQTVVDIGIDPAGGTAFTTLIPNLICGNASTYVAGSGSWFYFPIFIPAGATIGARGNSTVTTAFRVGLVPMRLPSNPSMIRKGSFVTSYGVTGNAGTAITAGSTSEGAWVSLGTTTYRHWWWQFGYQLPSTDTSHAAAGIHIDVATGDATKKDIIIQDNLIQTTSAEAATNIQITAGVEWEVPAGANLYVRAQSSGTAEASQIAVYGLGG